MIDLKGVQADISRIDVRLAELEQERLSLLNLREGLTTFRTHVEAPPRLYEQIREVLLQAGKELPLRDIHQKLVDKGRAFKGINPKMSIYSALARHPETFVRLSRGWGIANFQNNKEINT